MPANAAVPVAAEPVGAAEFAASMDRLGPFERRPRLAVAVSGGPDSLALLALAAGWAADRGGGVTALTVDHGLRPASGLEAVWVAGMASHLGVDHVVVPWVHDGGRRRSAAEAREARYRLLDEVAAERGFLHLLLGHHADDQAVTRAMRARRAAGPGLAGMASVRELAHCRLVRPLLNVPRARLEATADALGYGWIEDPSNRDPRYERTRTSGVSVDAGTVAARIDREHALAAALVASVRIEGPGAVGHDLGRMALLDADVRIGLLRAATATVGGRRHLPSSRAAAALSARLDAGVHRATLGGAIVERRDDRLHLWREWERAASLLLEPGEPGRFDGRFALRNAGRTSMRVTSLGVAAAQAWTRRMGGDWRVLASLPSVDGTPLPLAPTRHRGLACRWAPRLPLAPAPFAAAIVVSRCGLPT